MSAVDAARWDHSAGLPLRELNLTESQREQVRTIVESRESETRAIGERAMAAREALHAATTSPSFDEGLVRTRAAEVAAIGRRPGGGTRTHLRRRVPDPDA